MLGVAGKSSLSFVKPVFAYRDWHGYATRNCMNSVVYYRTLSDISPQSLLHRRHRIGRLGTEPSRPKRHLRLI